MPMPNHCIDCDKIATVTLNEVPYCAKCGLEKQQEEYSNGKNKGNARGRHEKKSRTLQWRDGL